MTLPDAALPGACICLPPTRYTAREPVFVGVAPLPNGSPQKSAATATSTPLCAV